VYMAMIKAVDRSVGAVMQALVDNDIDNNTLVIFTSDNGGAPYVGLPEINQPYRGWKLTFFEGGVHVPFFMRWPKEIAAGTVYDKPVAHVDLFSTAAAAAGVSVPGDRVIDGVDLLPFVKGVDTGYPHDTLFWRSGDYQVVLKRDTVTGDYWKMQVHDMPDKIWLYNLAVDPLEQNNLADTHPTRVAEMQAALDGYNAEQVDSIWPSALSGPVMVDKTQDEDMHVDDEYVYWQN
jgi:arylsulfatase A-like enzyme